MKTAILYEDTGLGISFFVVDGDQTRFDGLYINSSEDTEKFCKFMYEGYTGALRHTKASREEFVQAIRDGAEMIVCGFVA